MSDNKTGKYLKYAVGEIVLVVIGILIALSINNWNEDRKERHVELNLLQQFHKDIAANLNDLKANLGFQIASLQSTAILLSHFESQQTYHDSLQNHLASSFIWTKFIANGSAYENLKSRGVEIISDDELRERILVIFEQNFKWNEAYENMIRDRVEIMRTHYAKDFFKKLNVAEYDNGVLTYGAVEVIDYDALRINNDMIYFLNTMASDLRYQIEAITKKYIEDHELVLKRLDEQIATLK